jgi:hypothetical protein
MLNINNSEREDTMEAGRLIQEKLKEKNARIELDILDWLSALSIDIKTHDISNDHIIFNSAFLVHKNNLEEFEMLVDKLDEEYSGLLIFKLKGPVPCYSFYSIEVLQLDPENVAQAHADLGLREETSESEIKRAYLGKTKHFHSNENEENVDEESFNRITKAYHTLMDYSYAARQATKEKYISLKKEKVKENLILVKIFE